MVDLYSDVVCGDEIDAQDWFKFTINCKTGFVLKISLIG